ncbi:MAG: ribonuclease Z [Pedobacter sp.]|nr:MAG: ribonuclease Z [Pedobacter sp.]
MTFEVCILGSSSATPVYQRNPTAQILNCNERLYLIDCGEGTQQQLIKYGYKANKIDFIFISHLHGDHFFGLVGLLSSMHLNGRKKPLHLFCPANLKAILDIQFKYSETQLSFEIKYFFTQCSVPEIIFSNSDIIVETVILNHRIECTGFKFTERKRLRKLLVDKIEADNIPLSLYSLFKRGCDVEIDGKIYLNAEYTMDSAIPRTYAYISDTLMDVNYFQYIQNCDLLYHEATFMHDLLDRAKLTHHTTALEAGEVAQITGAKKLLIGHFSSRYKVLDTLLQEAKSVFPNTDLAIEGKVYKI